MKWDLTGLSGAQRWLDSSCYTRGVLWSECLLYYCLEAGVLPEMDSFILWPSGPRSIPVQEVKTKEMGLRLKLEKQLPPLCGPQGVGDSVRIFVPREAGWPLLHGSSGEELRRHTWHLGNLSKSPGFSVSLFCYSLLFSPSPFEHNGKMGQGSAGLMLGQSTGFGESDPEESSYSVPGVLQVEKAGQGGKYG